jgi:hypothetical protein
MHIVARPQPDAAVYRLKGRFDRPGAAQLAFILSRLPLERPVLFDFRRVVNAGERPAAELLREVIAGAPRGARVRLSGFGRHIVDRHSRDGVPRDAFV